MDSSDLESSVLQLLFNSNGHSISAPRLSFSLELLHCFKIDGITTVRLNEAEKSEAKSPTTSLLRRS